ncbi:hypothetical protein BDF21DRAFT_495755 [Thamnidium elegans]|nr:hypothetical protein BDF21DRAFT_495755 [Thamnidium elegans]
MKSVRLSFRKKFDDQYTFDLQNNLTVHDFHSIVGLFNQAARLRPPPGPKLFWIGTLLTMWMTASISFYLCWIHFQSPYILVALPASIITSSFFMAWLHRSRRTKFERNILEICSRLNATENIRGINFRFNKNGVDVTPFRIQSLSGIKSVYAIDIEFDDRYNALKSRQFNRRSRSEDDVGYILPPKSVYFNNQFADEKDSHGMFQEPPPCWSPPYNEKAHHFV